MVYSRRYEIIEKLDLTPEERELIDNSKVSHDSEISFVRALTTVYATKNLRAAIDDLVAANRELSESTTKYSSRLAWLTGALVVVGIGQVLAAVFG